jgi:hypothetical protein
LAIRSPRVERLMLRSSAALDLLPSAPSAPTQSGSIHSFRRSSRDRRHRREPGSDDVSSALRAEQHADGEANTRTVPQEHV